MNATLPLTKSKAISPMLEMGAYECLWAEDGATFKRIADRFRADEHALPTDVLHDDAAAMRMGRRVYRMLRRAGVEDFGVRVHRAGEYPARLRDARNPVELLYYQGIWNWVEMPSVAVVGSRKASVAGKRRARKLVQGLVEDGYAVVSGLAEGIDAAAHEATFRSGGVTIGVIGTPLSEAYPRSNAALQRRIADSFLLISQVPFYRYSQQHYLANRTFFPERNITMSALTLATVIVEAGETSGTLGQAKAALAQGRRLFILDSCFRAGLRWPERFEHRGAVRVRSYADIRNVLAANAG